MFKKNVKIRNYDILKKIFENGMKKSYFTDTQ